MSATATSRWLAVAALVAAACSSGPATTRPESDLDGKGTWHATRGSGSDGGSGTTATGSGATGGSGSADSGGSSAGSGSGAVAGAGSGSGSATTAAPPGADFIAEAKLLYRIAACGDQDQPLPTVGTVNPDKLAKTIKSHCKAIMDRMSGFRTTYFDKGRAWFAAVVPADAPKTVVYPFGGGDLISALVAFPDATEITTISLEMAGDPRRISTLALPAIETSLGGVRKFIGGLVSVGSNTSENLSAGQQNEIPTQVASFLLGLVAGGYEPIAMRYFKIEAGGALHYLEQGEIDELDAAAKAKRPQSLKHDWMDPSFSEAFANVELTYRKVGETAVRTHRHIGWNLGDDYLKKHPELIKHLEAKGKVTFLTKGASYLLWVSSFSTMRDYMLGHLAWMLSDSTGIPPAYAKKAGMVQETYGGYHGAFLEGSRTSKHDEAFIELWAKQPRRRLAFRFGYVDMDKQAHLVVTKPKPAKP